MQSLSRDSDCVLAGGCCIQAGVTPLPVFLPGAHAHVFPCTHDATSHLLDCMPVRSAATNYPRDHAGGNGSHLPGAVQAEGGAGRCRGRAASDRHSRAGRPGRGSAEEGVSHLVAHLHSLKTRPAALPQYCACIAPLPANVLPEKCAPRHDLLMHLLCSWENAAKLASPLPEQVPAQGR